jgi:alpha-galactosidase
MVEQHRAESSPNGSIVHGETMTVDPGRSASAFYRHGWQSWSDTRWVDPAETPPFVPVRERWPLVDDPAYATRRVHGGSAVGALELGSGDDVLLLGALGLGARIEYDGDRLRGRYETAAGDWFVGRGSEVDVFGRYAELLGQRFGTRPRSSDLRLWSSWYSCYRDISEERLAGILGDLEGFAFDTFQVDDGWQRALGDWDANDRFPSGMAALARRVTDAGLRPGLWIAPFIARSDSELYRSRPEIFLRDADDLPVLAGEGWGGPYYAVDVTHPLAREMVSDVIAWAVGSGYRLLKLDFLYAAALPGRRAADVPREAAYRQAVELIREVAGDDVYLLACGAPIVASLGVFDGMRIGPDVAPWWELEPITHFLHDISGPNTRYAIATSLHRLWLGSVIDTDPDVAYFRSRYSLLDASARQHLQDLARVARFRGTSDPPAWLDDDERAALVRFLDGEPEVERAGRHRYRIDGRDVDFGPVANDPPGFRHLTFAVPEGS